MRGGERREPTSRRGDKGRREEGEWGWNEEGSDESEERTEELTNREKERRRAKEPPIFSMISNIFQ